MKIIFKNAHSFAFDHTVKTELSVEEISRSLHAFMSYLGQAVRNGMPRDMALLLRDKARQNHQVAGGIHREGAPSGTRSDGRTGWHRDGKMHREYGPAMVTPRGEQEWWEKGKRR